MLVYYCRWERNDSPVPGQKGRRPVKGSYHSCTVLCRGVSDAMKCFTHYFYNKCEFETGVDICDGTLTFSLVKLDSRGFNVQFIQMDGISEPLELTDLKRSLLKVAGYLHK